LAEPDFVAIVGLAHVEQLFYVITEGVARGDGLVEIAFMELSGAG
jgi:hypothetical protein